MLAIAAYTFIFIRTYRYTCIHTVVDLYIPSYWEATNSNTNININDGNVVTIADANADY